MGQAGSGTQASSLQASWRRWWRPRRPPAQLRQRRAAPIALAAAPAARRPAARRTGSMNLGAATIGATGGQLVVATLASQPASQSSPVQSSPVGPPHFRAHSRLGLAAPLSASIRLGQPGGQFTLSAPAAAQPSARSQRPTRPAAVGRPRLRRRRPLAAQMQMQMRLPVGRCT